MTDRRIKPGMLALLVGVFIAVVAAVYLGRGLLESQSQVMTILSLGAFALFATGVLSGVLGSTGIVTTKQGKLGGAAAIFVSVFGVLITAFTQIPKPERRIGIVVSGLYEGEKAEVATATGQCSKTVYGTTGSGELVLRDACITDPATLLVLTVPGNTPVQTSYKREDLAAGVLQLQWTRTQTTIGGTVSDVHGPLDRGSITLPSCQKASPANILLGGFTLVVPPECQPPFIATLTDSAGRTYSRELAAGNRNVIKLTPAPRVKTLGPYKNTHGAFDITLEPAPDGLPPAKAYAVERGVYAPFATNAQANGVLFDPSGSVAQGVDLVLKPLDEQDLDGWFRAHAGIELLLAAKSVMNSASFIDDILHHKYLSEIDAELDSLTKFDGRNQTRCDRIDAVRRKIGEALATFSNDAELRARSDDVTGRTARWNCKRN